MLKQNMRSGIGFGIGQKFAFTIIEFLCRSRNRNRKKGGKKGTRGKTEAETETEKKRLSGASSVSSDACVARSRRSYVETQEADERMPVEGIERPEDRGRALCAHIMCTINRRDQHEQRSSIESGCLPAAKSFLVLAAPFACRPCA